MKKKKKKEEEANILHLLYRILILAGLEFRIPRSPHSEALIKTTPSGVHDCVEMVSSCKVGFGSARGDYFYKGVLLACPPWKLPAAAGVKGFHINLFILCGYMACH